jgi:CubicO group peptidase (beta-lactamase class C family)
VRKRFLFFLPILVLACSSDTSDNPTPVNTPLYFPPVGSDIWATTTPVALGWNESAVTPLLDYLEEKHSKAFVVLVDGKIVMESYFNGHSASSLWYWASAGKTLTAAMTGIASQEGLLDIDGKVSNYLGMGWTSAPPEKENLITNRHLLTMTSGLDDALGDNVEPANLQYKADAGTRWAYANVYVKLQDVIAEAAGQPYNDYFNAKLRDPIGMNGSWFTSGDNIVYASNARSMARFGLLMLAKGKWDDTVIVNESFCNAATTTSQGINDAYGYLWWLNGETTYHLPQSQFTFNGSLIPSAPNDMFMALGKNDQKIYIIPSKRMVIVRMGDAADDVNLALSDFDEVLWEKINALID